MPFHAALLRTAALMCIAAVLTHVSSGQDVTGLSGIWRFQTDPQDRGEVEGWYTRKLTDTIRLPGSMAERGKGDDVSVATPWTGLIVDSAWYNDPALAQFRRPGHVRVPFWLTPRKHYVGPAWYQRQVTIPRSWQGRHMVLSLERVHWDTRVWVDTLFAGSCRSLGTAHTYDLSRLLSPGTHLLTLRIDNRLDDVYIGSSAHSVTDHTQTNWNGIVGAMSLTSFPRTGIASLEVIPDGAARAFRFRLTLAGVTGEDRRMTVHIGATCRRGTNRHIPSVRVYPVRPAADTDTIEFVYPLGPDALLWDEFSPALYDLTVAVQDGRGREIDTREIRSGVRDLATRGTQFTVNGRPVLLRGTLESAIFPLTGYPPTDPASWRRIFRVCRSFGVNHVRFHSWCPPAAAFDAADETGIYLQVETGMWTRVGDGAPLDLWLREESERIIRAYGHHPSFCMLAAGNEPAGKNQTRYLGDLVSSLKNRYPGRLYTGASAWPVIPENDFHVLYGPRIQAWGAGLTSSINADPPQTTSDYRDTIARYAVPIISHEVGQWCAYPDLKEIRKYTGVLKAGNFEIVRATLHDHHLGSLAQDLLVASGKLQTLCYKADIEALLRTPGLGGFHLLDLHDFPGQGTAPVGVLNAFWEPKGYVAAEHFRQFCNSTVPLARLPGLIYRETDTLRAEIDVAHYGAAALAGVRAAWRLTTSGNAIVQRGLLTRKDIATGTVTSLGAIRVPLHGVQCPDRLRLTVRVAEFENQWDVWVFPGTPPVAADTSICIVQQLTPSLLRSLEAGAKVLLIAPPVKSDDALQDPIAVGFSPIFWNTMWTRGQAPHTLGILCDPGHPALAAFPATATSDWQWWDVLHGARAIRMPVHRPAIVPIVRLIDDWNTNRPLALLAEFRVGRGRLVVSGANLIDDLAARPPARQLRYSLLRYMGGSAFAPRVTLDHGQIRTLFPGCVMPEAGR